MTEHVLPVDGHDQGVLQLTSKADTIRVVSPVVVGLDSFGFGGLKLAWERLPASTCPDCSPCRIKGPVAPEDLASQHEHCGPIPHCGTCGHHSCARVADAIGRLDR